jgi:hypothetical protein
MATGNCTEKEQEWVNIQILEISQNLSTWIVATIEDTHKP